MDYYFEKMNFIREEVSDLNEINNKPHKIESVKEYLIRAKAAARLIWLEKELIVFALLQWLSIAIGYYIWVQIIGWIPESVWESVADSNSGSIADVIFLIWTFLCVGIVALPIGILSACMGTVHFLHRMGRKSTIAACLKIVLPSVWSLWGFSWIDGWWTVLRIVDRLPKKDDRRTLVEKARSEAVYYAWKVGTIGILPALVTGRDLLNVGYHSLSVIETKFKEMATLRIGYSVFCWVVGIAAYIGSILFFVAFPQLVDFNQPISSEISTFYFWLAVPIIISVGVVVLFLRPIYLVSVFDIYADFVEERGESLLLPKSPSGVTSALVVFLILCVFVLVIFLYRYPLGIMDMLSVPYGETYVPK